MEAALVGSAGDWVTFSVFPACGPSLLFLSEDQFYSYSHPILTSPFTWPKMTIPSLFLHWFNTNNQQRPTVLPGSRVLVIRIWLVQLGSDPSWWKAALNNLLLSPVSVAYIPIAIGRGTFILKTRKCMGCVLCQLWKRRRGRKK